MSRKITILLYLLLLSTNTVFSQCGPGTPSFVVNLSDNANAVWTSASVIRNDNCCGNIPYTTAKKPLKQDLLALQQEVINCQKQFLTEGKKTSNDFRLKDGKPRTK